MGSTVNQNSIATITLLKAPLKRIPNIIQTPSPTLPHPTKEKSEKPKPKP
jgi:hypothetical protein